jgi:hypothetical protein
LLTEHATSSNYIVCLPERNVLHHRFVLFVELLLLPQLLVDRHLVGSRPALSRTLFVLKNGLFKLGGLDVETNRDRDRERPSRRDQFLKLVEKILTVETDFFLALRSRSRSRSRRDKSRPLTLGLFISFEFFYSVQENIVNLFNCTEINSIFIR